MKVAAFQFPVSLSDPLTESFRGYAVQIRGRLDKSPGTRVALTLVVAGANAVVEFPYGKDTHEDFNAQLFSFEAFTTPQPTGPIDAPHQAQRLPPAKHCELVLMVTVQRRLAEQVFLEVDSLDLEIVDLESSN